MTGGRYPGRIIPGPPGAALPGYLGREVRLFRREPEHTGHDDQPATLMSGASLKALAPEPGGTAPGPRRSGMSITMTGTAAWAEHGWGGQQVSTGEAIARVMAAVPRCAVTTRNPDPGAADARVLHALARLRGTNDITFGVWCDIIRPGRIHVGDLVIGPEPLTD